MHCCTYVLTCPATKLLKNTLRIHRERSLKSIKIIYIDKCTRYKNYLLTYRMYVYVYSRSSRSAQAYEFFATSLYIALNQRAIVLGTWQSLLHWHNLLTFLCDIHKEYEYDGNAVDSNLTTPDNSTIYIEKGCTKGLPGYCCICIGCDIPGKCAIPWWRMIEIVTRRSIR